MKNNEVFLKINKQYQQLPLICSMFLNALEEKELTSLISYKSGYIIDSKNIDKDSYFSILGKIIEKTLEYIKALSLDNEEDLKKFSYLSFKIMKDFNCYKKAFSIEKAREKNPNNFETVQEDKSEIIIATENLILNIINYYDKELLEMKKQIR